VKTEKDLPPAKKNAYLKSLSALEMGNHSLVVSLLQPVVLEEPEFMAGRKLLREAEVMRSRGKSGFLGGLSGGGLSLGKSKGKKALETGNWQEAMTLAEKALESDPMGEAPNKELFEAAEWVASREREAVKALDAEAASAPTEEARAEASAKLAAARDRARTFEAIARFALETIGLNPKATKAQHELGGYLMRIEEYDEASKIFAEILRKTPNDLDARDRAKEAAARRSMQRADLDKSSFADLVKQRQVAGADDKVVSGAESEEDLVRAVYEAHEAGAPDREAARKLADLYFNKEEYDNALEYYRYISALANNTDPGLLRKIADIEVRKVARSIAEKQKELEAMAPDDPAAEALRAELAGLQQSRAEQMLDEARRRVERNPTDLQYRFELGEQMVIAGHFKEAIPELQKARSNPNTRTRALNLLGRCYSERNMLDLAAKTFTDVAAEIPGMDGTKKDILYNLGIVYERMGDKAKSLDCMKQIYEVDYGYLDVAERVESSYTA
jgi:tetratricopeptide (TPR) repeat protein